MGFFQNLFSRKISMAGWVSSFLRAGQPVWTERNFAALSREGYQKNVIVFRCIKLRAQGAAKIPFILRDRNTKKEIEDRNHPLWKLLHRPNPWQAGATFWENVYAYRPLHGNSYIEGVVGDANPAPMGPGRPPDQLYCKRPDYMQAVASDVGTVMAYVYSVGGRKQTWEMDPYDGTGAIIHWKTFNPLNDYYGMPELEAAAWAVDQHNEASQWNKSLLQNAGSPSGILTREVTPDAPTVLTSTQYQQLVERLENEIKGAKNAGRPIIGDNGLKWTAMSLSPKEMDWIEGKHVSSREICHAFGVPPFLLGIPGDSTYNNYKEARQGLYEDTILPDVDSLCDELNMKLAPLFGDNIEIGYDEDEIPALAPKRADKWTAVQGANWLTTDEKREATGYEPLATPEAEAVLIPTTLQPLDGILDAPVINDPANPDDISNQNDNENPAVDPKQDERATAKAMRAERKLAELMVRMTKGNK
jgi:HK97 family phage portal protein